MISTQRRNITSTVLRYTIIPNFQPSVGCVADVYRLGCSSYSPNARRFEVVDFSRENTGGETVDCPRGKVRAAFTAIQEEACRILCPRMSTVRVACHHTRSSTM